MQNEAHNEDNSHDLEDMTPAEMEAMMSSAFQDACMANPTSSKKLSTNHAQSNSNKKNSGTKSNIDASSQHVKSCAMYDDVPSSKTSTTQSMKASHVSNINDVNIGDRVVVNER
jgi:hypothetical protein